jgi:hypothetical protein
VPKRSTITPTVPAEIIATNDLTTSGDTGWKVYYTVRWEDGEEVTVDANCTDTAAVFAREVKDRETMEYFGDRGRSGALKYAESAQSPAQRGKVIVQLMIDSLNGRLRVTYDYEREASTPFSSRRFIGPRLRGG